MHARAKPEHDRRRRRGRPAPDVTEIMPLFNTGGPQYLGYRMVLASKLFDRCIARILAEQCELTLPQWRALAQLALIPDGTVRSLANGAAVDRSEASRALRQLETFGLVTRSVNGEDRRSPRFSQTDEGRKLVARVRKPIFEFIAGLVRNVDAEDLDTANRVMWEIAKGCIEAGGLRADQEADTASIT
jgi:DNA-binding MarR family transcriptional regulator